MSCSTPVLLAGMPHLPWQLVNPTGFHLFTSLSEEGGVLLPLLLLNRGSVRKSKVTQGACNGQRQ